MPIIEGNTAPWASIISGLVGAAGSYMTGQQQQKQAAEEKKRKDAAAAQALAYQNSMLDLSRGRLGVERTNAGLDPNTGAAWTPPTPTAAPATPTGAPDAALGQGITAPKPDAGLAGMLAGLTAPPPTSAPGATVRNSNTPPAGPAAASGGVSQALVQQAAIAKANVDSLLAINAKESKHADELEAQGAPPKLVKEARDRASKALAEAGTWMGHQQSAEKGILDAQGSERDAAQTAFYGHEQQLPTDPKAALSVLRKRLQIERGKGFDTKVTQQQITDIENRLQQAAVEKRHEQDHKDAMALANRRMGISIGRIGVDRGNTPASTRADAVEQAALAAPNEKAARLIVAQAHLGKRDRDMVLQDIAGQFKPEKVVPASRATLAGQANDVIAKGGDREKIVRDYATRAKISVKEADAELDQSP